MNDDKNKQLKNIKNNDINNGSTEYPFIKMKEGELYCIPELDNERVEIKPEIPRISFFATKEEREELVHYHIITGNLLTIKPLKKFVDTIYKFMQYLNVLK